jgi:transposase
VPGQASRSVKLIFWDGMVLVCKHREDGKFRWIGVQDAILLLNAGELQALLEGLDWRRVDEPRQTAVPTATSRLGWRKTVASCERSNLTEFVMSFALEQGCRPN